MTQEQQLQRNYFRLNAGLNTESNEINWPDGFTTDERNYELLRDGSRRKRKGLSLESGGGDDFVVSELVGTEKIQTYIWRNVGGDPDLDFYVLRCGNYLYFAEAKETVGTTWKTGDNSVVGLENFYAPNTTDEITRDAPVTFAQGRGRLLVSGQHIYPFYVEYSVGEFLAKGITVKIRDFTTIPDGTGVDFEPTVITDDHSYNLLNRGWRIDRIDQYNTDISRYPARNAVWHRGYRRVVNASVEEGGGDKEWDSDKLSKEAFGQSSAPVGSLFLNPTDTRGAGLTGDTGTTVNITTWSASIGPGYGDTWEVTLTVDADPSISVGEEFSIANNEFRYTVSIPRYGRGEVELDDFIVDITRSFDGTHTAKLGTSGTTIKFDWDRTPYGEFQGWIDQYKQLGQVTDGSSASGVTLNRSTGAEHPDSWQAIAWFAGRAWYAGMLNDEFNDYLMFSQIVDGPEKYGKCYQAADPTDENYNSLTNADGGTIIIPGMGGVIGMYPLRDSLIVFGRDGVWAVETGQGGFTPTSFRVRKLSEAGCNSVDGIVRIEDSMVYTGTGGIYLISPNQYTGQLEVQNTIRNTIQSLWASIPTQQQQHVQTVYDDAQRRLYFLYGATNTSYAMSTMLIYDIDLQAWFKYTFNPASGTALVTGGAIPSADDPTSGKKMKFIYTTSDTSVNVADFDQDDFLDFDGEPMPPPFMVTGWDNLGTHQRRRQAPIITVFSQRTETGFVSDGSGGYDAVNPSSTLMKGYWDWATDSTPFEQETNKITSQQEVYRHRRAFVPTSVNDLDGYTVVVTRNKLRGRGRALQLRFDAGDDLKDSHLLGFTINYKVSKRI